MTVQRNEIIRSDKDSEANAVLLEDSLEGLCYKDPEKWPMKKLRTKCQQFNTLCCLLFGFIAFVIGVLTLKYTFYEIVMDEKIKMTPGFPPFQLWLDPKPEIYCRVYLFTVKNPEEFLSGTYKKLKIEEFGPIVYIERITHTDVVVHENSTMSYTVNRALEFVPEMNEPGVLNKTIIVPNTVLLGMVAFIHDYPFSVKIGFNMISNKDPLFINTTVYNYLWNLTTPALDTVNTYFSFMVPQDNGGVLHNVYSDFKHRVNAKIGPKYDYTEFFQMITFDGRTTVPGYFPEKGDCPASLVNSTEGILYPNYLTKESHPLYWRKTVCKAVALNYEKEVKKGSITGYKYIGGQGMYDRAENLTADCYKSIGKTLLPDGLSDASKCYKGLPIAMSVPHFYGSHGYWENLIEGFNPSKEKHESFSIIEPITGVPLEQKARSQSQIVMPKLKHFSSQISRFSEMIVPISWIEYNQEKITPPVVFLVDFTVNYLPYLQYFISVIIGLTGLMYVYVGLRRLKADHDFRKLTLKLPVYITRSVKA